MSLEQHSCRLPLLALSDFVRVWRGWIEFDTGELEVLEVEKYDGDQQLLEVGVCSHVCKLQDNSIGKELSKYMSA